MADDIILQVDPELLKRKSANITNKIGEIERAFGAIESRINATRGYWTGDSSEKYQKYFKDIKPDMEKVIKRLKEHPKDLLDMAGLYVKGESAASEIATALPADVIE